MKILKSLLLGAAASVVTVAVAGAQAPDLLLRTKPVDYVKVCNPRGDGVYSVPGTDICVGFGGRAQSDYYGSIVTGERTPPDKWGVAVLSGFDVKMPGGSRGRVGGYVNYGTDPTTYSGGTSLSSPGLFAGGNRAALGWINDAYYLNGAALQPTTAWTAGVGYEHYWTSSFSSTVYGNYTGVSSNNALKLGNWSCGGQSASTPAGTPCDSNSKFWTVGTHTDWTPVAGVRLAVDVLYSQIGTAFTRPAGVDASKDQGVVAVTGRVVRSFPSGAD